MGISYYSIQKQNVLFFFLLISYVSFGQKNGMLKGKIVTNVLGYEPVNIVNLTQGVGVINDTSGDFAIQAAIGDEIVFSSIQFQLKTIVVKESDLQDEYLKIQLYTALNELDSVNITQYALSGDIKNDVKEIPTYEDKLPLWSAAEIKRMGFTWADDAQSPVQNTVLNEGNNQATVSIAALIDLFSGAFGIRDKRSTTEMLVTDFYKEEFFIKKLGIPETEFYDFLDFVREDKSLITILKTKDSLKILEFLMNQSQLYKEKYSIKE